MSGIVNSVGARGGIIGLDEYPTGHVLQQVHMSSTDHSCLANNNYTVTSITDTITGIGNAPSTFLMFAAVMVEGDTSHGYDFKFGKNDGGTLVGLGGMASQHATYIGKDTDGGQSLSLLAYDTPTATFGVTFEYTVWYRRSGGSGGGSIDINPGSSTSTMIILEIAG